MGELQRDVSRVAVYETNAQFKKATVTEPFLRCLCCCNRRQNENNSKLEYVHTKRCEYFRGLSGTAIDICITK